MACRVAFQWNGSMHLAKSELILVAVASSMACGDPGAGDSMESGHSTTDPTDGDGDGDGDSNGEPETSCPAFAEPTILALGYDDIMRGLEVDDETVYFARASSIMAVSKDAGVVETLVAADTAISGFAIDDDFVYWADAEGLSRVSKQGGTPTRLVDEVAANPVVHGDAVFYVAYLDTALRSIPNAGGSPTTWLSAPELANTTELASNGSDLVGLRTSTIPAGPMQRLVPDAMDVSLLLDLPGTVRDLHVDDASAYFASENDQAIVRVALDGTKEPEIVGLTEGFPFAVGTDEQRIYWSDDVLEPDQGTYRSSLMCLDREADDAIAITEFRSIPATLRVARDGIYWSVWGHGEPTSGMVLAMSAR